MEKIVNRLLIVSLVMAAVLGGAAFLFRNAEHDPIQEDEMTLPLCEYIDIDLLRLDVDIIPYDEEKIRISYKNDVPLDIEVGDNRISITESDEFVISIFAGSTAEYGLYMYLPREIYREISVTTGTGNVNVGRVDSERLSIITGSGDISCRDTVSLTYLTTTTGFISLDFETVAAETTLLSRAGDAEIILPPNSSVAMDFETDTGECVTDLISGNIYGSFMYSFNGGDKLIHATVEKGTLTVRRRE